MGKGILAGLNVDEGGSNLLALILKGNKGYFYLNDAFVTELDLSERTNYGNVYIVTGMLSGDEIGGSMTKYSDFSIWTIP